MEELTFGQKAVGLNFNPAEGITGQRVHVAKQLFANAIDLVEEVVKENEKNGTFSWTHSVFRTAAFNACITAQMAVVKFITWKN